MGANTHSDAFDGIVIRKKLRSSTRLMKRRCLIDKLSDDDLTEILLRLPLLSGDVHRCKCVSKRWLNLISHPSFSRSYVQFQQQQQQQHGDAQRDDFLLYSTTNTNISYIEVWNVDSPPKSKLFNFSFSFIPSLLKGYRLQTPTKVHGTVLPSWLECPKLLQMHQLKYLTVLRVSNGLILLEGLFVTSTALYVCNPLTKQWLELSSPSYFALELGAVSFMCHETCAENGALSNSSSSSSLLTVIVVSKDDTRQHFIVSLFTSDDTQWRRYNVPYPLRFSWPKTFNIVACNDMFHWNGRSNIVVYDPSRKGYPRRCDVINMPADAVTGYSSKRLLH